MRQAIVTFDRQTQKILHANDVACELLESDLASLRDLRVDSVIPEARLIEFDPRRTVARRRDGREISINVHKESLSTVDTKLPDLTTLHFWPPVPAGGALTEGRYSRLETLWQLVVEPGRTSNELAEAILNEATTALGTEYGALGYVDGDEVVIEHILGDGTFAPGMRVPLAETLARHAIETNGTFEIPDVAQAPAVVEAAMVRRFGLRSFVTLTFHASQKTWVLSLSSRQSRDLFDPEETAYLKLLTDVLTRLLDRAQQEERISHLAFYDPLTDLPNRAATIARIGEVLSSAQRSKERSALFFMDIDGFKKINDVYGHSAGDGVLVEIAKRMRETLRRNEFMGRIGGDEFAVIFPQFRRESDLLEVAERLLAAVSSPLERQLMPSEISASIGIAIFPDDATTREELLAHADAAMYRAKSQVDSRYCWYNKTLAQELKARRDLQTELQTADLEREFLLCYQPIVEPSGGKLVAVEALLRWLHPTQGLLSPQSFMQVAESNRLSALIDAWVVGAALTQSKKWTRGGRSPYVHMNITTPTWGILDAIEQCAAVEGADLSLLTVEMGEAAVANDFELTVRVAAALRERGVRIGLNAFCSMGIPLKRIAALPVDFVKLDRELVAGLFRSEPTAVTLEAAIALANAFGWHVIAEGVESQHQREWLERHGVDAVQGYAVAHPMTAHDFDLWLEQHG